MPRCPLRSTGLRSLARLATSQACVIPQGRWASWPEADARRIEKADFLGIDHLLQAYGGMGSLNDMTIDDTPGSNVSVLVCTTLLGASSRVTFDGRLGTALGTQQLS